MRTILVKVVAALTVVTAAGGAFGCPRQAAGATLEPARSVACCCGQEKASGSCCCKPGDPRTPRPEPAMPTGASHENGAAVLPAGLAPSTLALDAAMSLGDSPSGVSSPGEKAYLSNCSFRC